MIECGASIDIDHSVDAAFQRAFARIHLRVVDYIVFDWQDLSPRDLEALACFARDFMPVQVMAGDERLPSGLSLRVLSALKRAAVDCAIRLAAHPRSENSYDFTYGLLAARAAACVHAWRLFEARREVERLEVSWTHLDLDIQDDLSGDELFPEDEEEEF